jgi:hypothetical protein
MRHVIVRFGFLLSCVIAALMPLKAKNTADRVASFPGWPLEWEGEPLEQVPLEGRDEKFNQNFPGRIAKFTDGRREFIFRWVTTASRQLHSSADCFRGMGYSITPQPAIRDLKGKCWSRFVATRRENRFLVRERITDERGNEWSDVSAWFWSVAFRQTEGPWLSVTIVERSV